MNKRTIENCGLIKSNRFELGSPEKQGDKCVGYQVSEFDDEPCSTCKRCKLNMSYEVV
jgi:hypothetical protein